MQSEVAELSEAERALVARQIQREIDRRQLSRYQLAERAKLSLSTVEKALIGQFSERTLVRIETAIDKKFITTAEASPTGGVIAPEEMGAYTKKSVRNYIAEYQCIRPAFERPDMIYTYLMDISWDDEAGCLRFSEKKRADPTHTQSGFVYIPQSSPYISLVTISAGWVRHVIASQLDGQGIMRGLVQTLFNPRGNMFMPVNSPIVLRKTGGSALPVGRFDSKSANYGQLRDLLDETFSQDFAKQISVAISG